MKGIIAAFLVVLIGSATIVKSSDYFAASPKMKDLDKYPLFARLPPKAIVFLTLGQKRLYNIYLYLYVLQNLTSKRLKSYNPDKLAKWLDTILKHKPEVEGLYLLACFTMISDFNKPDYCRKILDYGQEAMPESWLLPVTQGWVYLFKKMDLDEAYKFYHIAAQKPGVPSYVGGLSEKIKTREILKSKAMQEQFFNQIELIKEKAHGKVRE